MELNWDFKKIFAEIESIKQMPTKTFEQEVSKYFALKAYYDLLLDKTANDYQLDEKESIREYIFWMHNYSDEHAKAEKQYTKIFNERSYQTLIDFLKLCENHPLINTLTKLNDPIIKKYGYEIPPDMIVKTGDEFYNSLDFMPKNILSKAAAENLISLTELEKTMNPFPTGTYYTTGHTLCSYKEKPDFYTLMTIIHETAHSDDFSNFNDFFTKEKGKKNIFSEFYPMLAELMCLDFISEKSDSFALDINLYKHNMLDSQNIYLKRVISKTSHPNELLNEIQRKKPKFLLEAFSYKEMLLLPPEQEINEKEHYEAIINYMERELIKSQNTNTLTNALIKLKSKLKNPASFILSPYDDIVGNKHPSARFAREILANGKNLLSTLLAMKFYYLIKDDREKGMDLLEKVKEELITNHRYSAQTIKKYELEDYLQPDYIQQYAAEYNAEKEIIKKGLSK